MLTCGLALMPPTTGGLLPLDVLWLLWEGPVSNLSPHFHGLYGLPQEGGRPVSENHILLELYVFSAKF